jgi:hypothetical protein
MFDIDTALHFQNLSLFYSQCFTVSVVVSVNDLNLKWTVVQQTSLPPFWGSFQDYSFKLCAQYDE